MFIIIVLFLPLAVDELYYKCRLGSLGNSSAVSRCNDPRGGSARAIVRPLGLLYFVPTLLLSIVTLFCLPPSVSLSFIVPVPMRKCSGKHYLLRYYTLNETCFLHSPGIVFVSVGEC